MFHQKNEKEAEAIGGRYAVYAVMIGLVCIPIAQTALAIMYNRYQSDTPIAFLKALMRYPLPSFFGLAVLFTVAYRLGKRAGRKIIIEKRDDTWISFTSAMVALLACYLAGSVVSFSKNCIVNSCDWEYEYTGYLAVGFIVLLAIIPTMLIAFAYGSILKSKRQMTKHNTPLTDNRATSPQG